MSHTGKPPLPRAQLPARRAADLAGFEHGGRRWIASFGRFSKGRLAEVCLDAAKESPLADAAREAAILASIALLQGAGLDAIRHVLDGRDQSPMSAGLALLRNVEDSHV